MSNGKRPLPRITLANARPPYDEEDGDYEYFVGAADNPFRPDSKGFELVNAWWLCEAATPVYSDPGGNPGLFERLKDGVRGLLPLDPAGAIDPNFFNLIPDAVEDHAPTLYAAHIWNEYVGGRPA